MIEHSLYETRILWWNSVFLMILPHVSSKFYNTNRCFFDISYKFENVIYWFVFNETLWYWVICLIKSIVIWNASNLKHLTFNIALVTYLINFRKSCPEICTNFIIMSLPKCYKNPLLSWNSSSININLQLHNCIKRDNKRLQLCGMF